MASSPGSAERRANLIREMSRQGNRSNSRASVGSSDAGSEHIVVKDWAATESQGLPALPTFSPDKTPQRPHDPDYRINTSALRRAFPDFSQHGSSDDDSIEFGRAVPRRNASARTLPSEDPSENISLNFGNGEKYTVTGTPPIKPKSIQNIRPSNSAQPATKKGTQSVSHGTGKENQDPAVKTTSYGSSTSSGDAKEQKRPSNTISAVEPEESVSIFSRPKAHYPSTKSTRFTGAAAREPLGENKNTYNTHAQDTNNNNTIESGNSAINGTYQSFMLPDMPNMTELMTGQRKDGTPNPNRSAKRSRFGTPSQLRKSSNAKSAHTDLSSVPVPADAKALYLSLQLLQEKLQTLEVERDQAVEKADNYELELLQLRSQVDGQKDVVAREEEFEDKTSEWYNERANFEKSISNLQSRLRQASKKLTASEGTVKVLTKDRDVAQQQLSEAYFNSEELRNESQAVRQEIDTVKGQLTLVTKQHESRIARLVSQENELRGKIERREKAVNEMASVAKELWNTRNALARKYSPREASTNAPASTATRTASAKTKSISHRQVSNPEKHTTFEPLEVANGLQNRTRRSNFDDSVTINADERRSSYATTRRQTANEDTERGGRPVDSENFRSHLQHLSVADLERCDTYLSFMEGDEVAKLRAVLQQDKARLTSNGLDSVGYETLESAHPTIPRKSSLRNASKASKKQQVQYQDDEEICQEITTEVTRPISRASAHSRRQTLRDDDPLSTQFDLVAAENGQENTTRQTIHTDRSDRRHSQSAPAIDPHDENMTSAYILPDITMTGAELTQNIQSKPTSTEPNTKIKVSVQQPIPVSERPVSPTPSNPDPTLRPSREPSVALKLVIRSLEAEIHRLKEQMSQYEAMYRQTDPALSKRRRKAVWARIVKSGETMERRSDQVYALYDVLEAFKAGEKGEEDVEVTLGELGLDGVVRAEGQKEGDEEGDDELPYESDGAEFEGFGTETQTGTGVVGR